MWPSSVGRQTLQTPPTDKQNPPEGCILWGSCLEKQPPLWEGEGQDRSLRSLLEAGKTHPVHLHDHIPFFTDVGIPGLCWAHPSWENKTHFLLGIFTDCTRKGNISCAFYETKHWHQSKQGELMEDFRPISLMNREGKSPKLYQKRIQQSISEITRNVWFECIPDTWVWITLESPLM